MSQENPNVNMSIIDKINAVEGFDPHMFAVDFDDLLSGKKVKRLPVAAQIAWFRLKYPEGKITLQTIPSKDCFVATARIYLNYKDPAEHYISEATASRSFQADKPSISPREWAQTAAIGIALKNAGYGLQFAFAGDDFPPIASDELSEVDITTTAINSEESDGDNDYQFIEVPQPAMTQEDIVNIAASKPCPIQKYSGKTLGEVMLLDPKALIWIANKYEGDEKIKEAAKVLCEYAVNETVS